MDQPPVLSGLRQSGLSGPDPDNESDDNQKQEDSLFPQSCCSCLTATWNMMRLYGQIRTKTTAKC